MKMAMAEEAENRLVRAGARKVEIQNRYNEAGRRDIMPTLDSSVIGCGTLGMMMTYLLVKESGGIGPPKIFSEHLARNHYRDIAVIFSEVKKTPHYCKNVEEALDSEVSVVSAGLYGEDNPIDYSAFRGRKGDLEILMLRRNIDVVGEILYKYVAAASKSVIMLETNPEVLHDMAINYYGINPSKLIMINNDNGRLWTILMEDIMDRHLNLFYNGKTFNPKQKALIVYTYDPHSCPSIPWEELRFGGEKLVEALSEYADKAKQDKILEKFRAVPLNIMKASKTIDFPFLGVQSRIVEILKRIVKLKPSKIFTMPIVPKKISAEIWVPEFQTFMNWRALAKYNPKDGFTFEPDPTFNPYISAETLEQFYSEAGRRDKMLKEVIGKNE